MSKGTSTIRALGALKFSMSKELENNDYCLHITRTIVACMAWYSMYTCMFGALITIFIGIVCLLSFNNKDPVIMAMILPEIIWIGKTITHTCHDLNECNERFLNVKKCLKLLDMVQEN